MLLVNLKNISKSIGGEIIFAGCDLSISASSKIAVVGPNGSGKTTLLKIIAGEENPDSGRIEKAKSLRIGHLHQEETEKVSKSLFDFVTEATKEVTEVKRKLVSIAERISKEADRKRLRDLLVEHELLEESFEAAGGFEAEHRAEKILTGLGFKSEQFRKPVEYLSGGWRMRAALARVLSMDPDLLLLDEPTNHLDLSALIWLEEFLRGFRGALVFVSHDPTFINNLAEKVVSIENKKVIAYKGDYDSFVEQKEMRRRHIEAAYINQQRIIAEKKRFIERYKARKTHSQLAKSRIKALQKMEKIELEPEPVEMKCTFPDPPRSGELVISLENLKKSYGDTTVYSNLNFKVVRGDKIAFVGPNGSGKSTLLKIMAGVEGIDSGRIITGHNVKKAYFSQHQLESLNPERTVLEEVWSKAPHLPQSKVRAILGAFLLSQDEVNKKISSLSGGERSRVALAAMLTDPPNFILMDEPTNNLDLRSRDILEKALKEYRGTICFVTHDRRLINKVANKVALVENGDVEIFHGNYDDFVRLRSTKAAAGASSEDRQAKKNKAASAKSIRKTKEQKRLEAQLRNRYYRLMKPLGDVIREIEDRLAKVMNDLDKIKEAFADPRTYENAEKLKKLIASERELKREEEELTGQWEKLSEEHSRLQRELEGKLASIRQQSKNS